MNILSNIQNWFPFISRLIIFPLQEKREWATQTVTPSESSKVVPKNVSQGCHKFSKIGPISRKICIFIIEGRIRRFFYQIIQNRLINECVRKNHRVLVSQSFFCEIQSLVIEELIFLIIIIMKYFFLKYLTFLQAFPQQVPFKKCLNLVITLNKLFEDSSK